uniref:Uncharacterized protein n=1 Tax=Megaselia scalaris TaxID=36166 RepID=T1GBJ2_MEGSC
MATSTMSLEVLQNSRPMDLVVESIEILSEFESLVKGFIYLGSKAMSDNNIGVFIKEGSKQLSCKTKKGRFMYISYF